MRLVCNNFWLLKNNGGVTLQLRLGRAREMDERKTPFPFGIVSHR